MIICPKYQLVYLAPPKTGSTAVKNLLLSRKFGGKRLGRPVFAHHDVVWQPRFNHWFTFITVRQPYRRMISMWQFSLMRLSKPTQDKFSGFFNTIFESEDRSFSAFINSKTVHDCSQAVWRYNWHLYKFNKPVDLVVYQENLNNDIKKVPCLANEELSVVNTSKILDKPWYEYYTPEAVDKVKEWFAVDFQRFNYNTNFDECANGRYFKTSVCSDTND